MNDQGQPDGAHQQNGIDNMRYDLDPTPLQQRGVGDHPQATQEEQGEAQNYAPHMNMLDCEIPVREEM